MSASEVQTALNLPQEKFSVAEIAKMVNRGGSWKKSCGGSPVTTHNKLLEKSRNVFDCHFSEKHVRPKKKWRKKL
ncbi:hypothetical protein K0M31_008000 [Melipona bicolor]|uniref:Uncharacterized protein n=1 Tax=Melipona bicolor TaxID=60889 RepID=A0AA40GCJ1_9HYME|nr:hypothetical protein K0M31_008000 [Melipona bicolor]